MKLLLDQGLPRSAAARLRAEGFDAIHVAEVGLSNASDIDLMAFARAERRVVVTLDADFHALLATSIAAEPSVVRMRVEGLRAEALVTLLRDVLLRCSAELDAGAVVSVEAHRIRLRRLPLGR